MRTDRQGRQPNRTLVVALVAGAVGVAAVFGYGGVAFGVLMMRGRSAAFVPGAGAPWGEGDQAAVTLRDVRDRLAAGGLKYRIFAYEGATYLVEDDPSIDPYDCAALAARGLFSRGTITIDEFNGTGDAKEAAGRLEARADCWGRFMFRSDPGTLDRVAKALR